MSRHILTACVVFALAAVGVGCKDDEPKTTTPPPAAAPAAAAADPYVTLAERYVKAVRETVALVNTTKTEAQADVAVPKLEALAKELEAVRDDLKQRQVMGPESLARVQKVIDDGKPDAEMAKAGTTGAGDPKADAKVGPMMPRIGNAALGIKGEWARHGVKNR
jgi:hypothetical protein